MKVYFALCSTNTKDHVATEFTKDDQMIKIIFTIDTISIGID